tara:strand:+ start:5442 stop:5705 length:264 start_codon:yes stop_codon:yes gene_type:complete
MKLYRIKRISDGKFYRSKSKFTSFGTYFRIQQIKGNLDWVQSRNKELELISYDIKEDVTVNVNEIDDIEDILKILDRNSKINKILDN